MLMAAESTNASRPINKMRVCLGCGLTFISSVSKAGTDGATASLTDAATCPFMGAATVSTRSATATGLLMLWPNEAICAIAPCDALCDTACASCPSCPPAADGVLVRSLSMRPSLMEMMRRARRATVGSCVTMMTVMPRVRCSSPNRSKTSLPVLLSNAPVGSSANKIVGWLTSARAMATRCCWPPDNSTGLFFSLLPRPTAVMASTARS